MAEEALQKLEEQLNCSICLDTYTDPKVLQCFHVYCQQCLVLLVDRDQQGQLSLTCPICRQVTPVPGRVADLQSAFHINRFLEVQDSFQRLHNPVAAPEERVRIVRPCSEHTEEELKLYCETCQELVCLQCIIKSGRHHNHDYDDINQAFQKYKEEITPSLEPMEKQVMTINKALVQFDTHCGDISDQQAATKNNIRTTFRQLREVLNVRESKLVSQLDRITQGKLKGLAAQRDQIETTLAQLTSSLYYMRESLNTDSKLDALSMKATTVRRVKELTVPFQADFLKPGEKVDVVFLAPAHFTATCQNYGLLSAAGLLDPNPRLRGKKPIEPQECELASEVTGTRCNIDCHQPTIIERHQQEPVNKPILTIEGLQGPCGVAINHQRREVVVAEWDGYCISVFSPDGEKIRSFGSHGSCEGQLNGPRGVAVNGEGNILLADYWNNRVQMFTAGGQFLTAVGTKGSGALQFSCPTGIAFNASNGKIYVVDWANHRVQILNSDLTFFSTFGQEGSGKGQFSYPCGINVDGAGKVYVADSCNHRIQAFTAQGEFLTMFGCYEGMVELSYPNDIAVSPSGKVYVTEGDSYRISAFSLEGHFVTSFGRLGEGLGEFNWPCGLSVDNSGAIYVCDYRNNRIQVFS